MRTFLLGMLLFVSLQGRGQANELAQLALDIEKLAQFKQILTDLKKTYAVLFEGYTTIKNISEGNFNLHKTFLDGLWAVSPTVQQYKKIAGIVSMQVQLVKEYQTAYKRFSTQPVFSAGELDYIKTTHEKLLAASLKNLDALLNIVTANKLRMSDAERLAAIDALFASMEDKLVFLRHFNSSTSVLAIQRKQESAGTDALRRLYQSK